MSAEPGQFIGTKPVTEQHRFDVEALAVWLEQHLDGFSGPVTVQMFKGGQSNREVKAFDPAEKANSEDERCLREFLIFLAAPWPVCWC